MIFHSLMFSLGNHYQTPNTMQGVMPGDAFIFHSVRVACQCKKAFFKGLSNMGFLFFVILFVFATKFSIYYCVFTDYPQFPIDTLNTVYQKDGEKIPTTQTSMHLDVWSCQPKQSNSTRFKLVLCEHILSRPISLVNTSV